MTTVEAVETAATLPLDYLGFIFHPASPRHLSLEMARTLGKLVPPPVKKVAVTVNPSEPEMAAIIHHLRPDLLQLHGEESPQKVMHFKNVFGLPIIKAISVASPEDIAIARAYESVVDFLLFDTKSPDPTQAGGTGKIFDWNLLNGQVFAVPWFLSGGLSEKNIVEAIRKTGAHAVDISSSLEKERGVKAPEKMKQMIKVLEPYRA